MRLPAVGVFEIPMGCTAQSDEWYFQASFLKDLQRQWVSSGVPSLRQIPSLEFANTAIGQVRLNTESQFLGRRSRAGDHGQPEYFTSISLEAVCRDRGGHLLRRLVGATEIAWEGSSGFQTRGPCGRTGTPPDSTREGSRRRAVGVIGDVVMCLFAHGTMM